jgi:23S rRNA (cytosine1962-C5)-methyltransferase
MVHVLRFSVQIPAMQHDLVREADRPSSAVVRVWLTQDGEKTVRRRRPWLFAGHIQRVSQPATTGATAIVYDEKRRFVAVGMYDADSPIQVRLLEFGQQTAIDSAWLTGRLNTALALRFALDDARTNGWRLVYGESDRLPGLVIDRYASVVVVKFYTGAWARFADHIYDWCLALAGVESVVARCARSVAAVAGSETWIEDGSVVRGSLQPGEQIQFLERGLRMYCDPCRGQKTGFFLDQRDNRTKVGALSAGKSVLNVFAYNGGFSLHAARGGARTVTSLDISRPALLDAERNFRANQDDANVERCEHQTLAGDAFVLLAALARQGSSWDIVIIDPPAFAKEAAHVDRALAAYQKLARLGTALVNRGGVLVLASCSSRVTPSQFEDAMHAAVQASGRRVRRSERTGHPADHPIGFEQAEYLKCLFMEVD